MSGRLGQVLTFRATIFAKVVLKYRVNYYLTSERYSHKQPLIINTAIVAKF